MKPNDLIGLAQQFAMVIHADQGQTYDGEPYSKHLREVVDTLMRFGEYDKAVIAAGWLHDVVEDCTVSLSTIEDLFGPKVLALVAALTDEPGVNRKERKAKTYPKIKGTPGAVKLKLADRIANVENGIRRGDKRFFLMYKKEQPGFEAALRGDFSGPDADVNEKAMWDKLNYLFVAGEQRFAQEKPL